MTVKLHYIAQINASLVSFKEHYSYMVSKVRKTIATIFALVSVQLSS